MLLYRAVTHAEQTPTCLDAALFHSLDVGGLVSDSLVELVGDTLTVNRLFRR